jgi:hypothetical protein
MLSRRFVNIYVGVAIDLDVINNHVANTMESPRVIFLEGLYR